MKPSYRPVGTVSVGAVSGVALMCIDCGVLVGDAGAHDDFHARLDRLEAAVSCHEEDLRRCVRASEP